MRRIIMLATLSATLFGGVAMASPRYESERGHGRVEQRTEQRDESRRAPDVRDHRSIDRDARPAPRVERHEERGGFHWVGGEWNWNGYEWIWTAGHYVRISAW